MTEVTSEAVTGDTSIWCSRAEDAPRNRTAHRPDLAGEVNQVAEKKISPKATSAKSSTGDTQKAAATRVTKKRITRKRVTRKKLGR